MIYNSLAHSVSKWERKMLLSRTISITNKLQYSFMQENVKPKTWIIFFVKNKTQKKTFLHLCLLAFFHFLNFSRSKNISSYKKSVILDIIFITADFYVDDQFVI